MGSAGPWEKGGHTGPPLQAYLFGTDTPPALGGNFPGAFLRGERPLYGAVGRPPFRARQVPGGPA